jgi:hypothetical protein
MDIKTIFQFVMLRATLAILAGEALTNALAVIKSFVADFKIKFPNGKEVKYKVVAPPSHRITTAGEVRIALKLEKTSDLITKSQVMEFTTGQFNVMLQSIGVDTLPQLKMLYFASGGKMWFAGTIVACVEGEEYFDKSSNDFLKYEKDWLKLEGGVLIGDADTMQKIAMQSAAMIFAAPTPAATATAHSQAPTVLEEGDLLNG